MIVGLTGAASFRGELLLSKLIASPQIETIHVFDIKSPLVHSTKIVVHRVDLLHEDASEILEILFQKAKLDILVHGALYSGPQIHRSYAREVESIGTFHVLNAVASSQCKHLIVLSDTFVYGALAQHPNFISETQSLRSVGVPHFVKTRVDVEKQVAEFSQDYKKIPVTVMRFAPILGPTSTNLRAQYFLSGVVPKIMGFDPLLQFMHEDDAALAMLTILLHKPVPGIYNFAGNGVLNLTTAAHLSGKFPVPIPSFLCKGAFALGNRLKIWETAPSLVTFFQYLCVANVSKAEKTFLFKPKYSSRQALKAMIEADKLQRFGFGDNRLAGSTVFLGEERLASEQKEYRRL
jgi:UDP-glucose 4-epimerase